MPVIMDDPTTYLKRDSDNVALALAGNVGSVMFQARLYGISIQVNMPGGGGIRAITNQAEAMLAVGTYPASTPWCIVNDGLWDDSARKVLTSWFGPPRTMDKAFDVKTVGVAWRPDRMPVYGM